tara:strand:+ start:432 stop:686 length:255 start_codon:yes stop_codon:yes gene_type:complete
MTNKEILKKQIIYRSRHRGTKEMDILLGKFVEKNIAKLDEEDLINLNEIMSLDDELLHQWYFNNIDNNKIFNSKISQKLKKFIL